MNTQPEMKAAEYIHNYGVENAVANFIPYSQGEMVFIIPTNILPEVRRLLSEMGFSV